MITIREQLCYSPHPPESYVKDGQGVGGWCKGDIQLWNLIWLSTPEVDQYLDGVAVHLLPMYAEGDRARYIGHVMACLEPEVDGFERMRQMLNLEPQEFIRQFVKTSFQDSPTFLFHGMPWLETMRGRAVAATANQAIAVARGNVIYGKFGTR